jgi:hypothetical protein
VRFLLGFALITAACAFAQQGDAPPNPLSALEAAPPASGEAQNPPGTSPSDRSGTSNQPNISGQAAAQPAVPLSKQQPKRILGVMPNFRAVSAGAIPPPPTPRHAFKIATQNSFDYSSFIFVGITSLMAEESDAHKQLGDEIGRASCRERV